MMVKASLASRGDVFAAQDDVSLVRIVQDAHVGTWFSLDSSDLHVTHRGSRPGSPLADISFNCLMRAVLSDLRTLVSGFSSLQAAACKVGLEIPVLAWVDDVALVLPHLDALTCDATLQSFLPAVEQVFNSYGMRLNFSKNKTEIMCRYKGSGSTQANRTRFVDCLGVLPLRPGVSIRVVSDYVHLGAVCAQSMSITHELKQRIGKASSVYRQLAKSLFGNKHIPVPVRLTLLDSLVVSVLMHGCGIWPLLSAQQYRSVDSVLTGWQRRITGQHYCQASRLTDEQFRAQWQLPSLAMRLAKHRLLFMVKVYHHAPPACLDVITAADASVSGGWFDAVRHALRWFAYESRPHSLLGSSSPEARVRHFSCEGWI